MSELVRSSNVEEPDSTTAVGRLLDWHEPGWGQARDYVEQSFATFEVTAVGGEPSSDGPSDGPIDLARAMLSSAAFMPGCDGLELRYVATPSPSGVASIRMFITAKSCHAYGGQQLAAAAATAAVSALPPAFARMPVTRRWMDTQPGSGDPVFELRRNEEVTFPTWEYIPAEFFYHIGDTPGDGSGWRGFWHVLSKVSRTVTISILFKQTDLHPMERHVVGAVSTELAVFAEARRDVDLIGYETLYPGCENAAVALGAWQERLQRLQRPLLARVAVRSDYATAIPIASALAAAIGDSSDSERLSQPMLVDTPVDPGDYPAAYDGFDWLEIFPWGGSPIWKESSAPHSLRRFPYLYGLDEAAGLAVLPVADAQGVPGFARARRTASRRAMAVGGSGEAGVVLGDLLYEDNAIERARLPLSAINRHVLVVGTPGSGKTTTVLTMLASLWRDFSVPFLVIEPTKSEYRALLNTPGMQDLRVVCLGRDDIAPMRLNPLDPPPGVRMEVQANAVLASLKAALPLRDPLPELLGDAIERAYYRAGWHYDTTSEDGVPPPSLRTVMGCFEEAFEEAGYVGEARNVASAMSVRLKSLVRGSKGRVLDTIASTDFEALMSRPVVIEMDEIVDPDDKSVMAMFILDRLRASARGRGSSDGSLRHVTVVEEAHRLLAQLAPAPGDGGESARAAGVEAFSNAIAELRSFGEGFILSSQSPSRLAAAVVDNCGTRILHRIESSADRESVLADLDANQLEREAAARLRTGEAIARWPQIEEPEMIQVVPGEGIDSGGVVTGEDVKRRMAVETTTVRQLLPYQLCTPEVCASGCAPSVRSAGEGIARSFGRSAAKIWEENDGTIEALQPIAANLRREASGDRVAAYCGAVHLAVLGHALNVRRRVDIREKIRAALDEPDT